MKKQNKLNNSVKEGVKNFFSNKSRRYIAIGAAVTLVAAGYAYNALAPKAVPALSASVQQITDSFYEDGVVRAKSRSVVSADISGKVLGIDVQEGQFVRAGDVICTLDASALEAERVQLQAERDSVLASYEQNRDQIKQQIAGLQAQRASYGAGSVGALYEQQIQLLAQSIDSSRGDSVAWGFKQMISAARWRINAGEDQAVSALNSQLDAAKAQRLAIENQLAQYIAQAAIQRATINPADTNALNAFDANVQNVENSYNDMLTAADKQIKSLQDEIDMGGYVSSVAQQSEVRALEEQYTAFIYNTKVQMLALTAQQEQAAAAEKGAQSAKSAIKDQIDILSNSLDEDSGTATYYSTLLAGVDAGLKEIERRIELASVTAPIDGVVGAVSIKAGQYVSIGSVITEIVNPDNLHVECMLLTEDMAGVSPGMRAEIIWERREGDTTYGGTVLEISSLAVDFVSAVGLTEQRVKAIIAPEFGADAHPGDGFQVRVRFTTAQANAIVVPRSAIVESEQGDAVYVLKENKAVLTPVSLGLESGNLVAVLGGLNENDIVVENPETAGAQEGKGFKAQQ